MSIERVATALEALASPAAEPRTVRYEHGYGCDAVLCPSCGDIWTHIERVDLWLRGEDSNKPGVTVDFRGVQFPAPGESPSPRREGIRVHMTCESGCPEFHFDVWQHKGNTFVAANAKGGE